MNKVIDTPCVGICSTVYGDMICRGCKRVYNEVIDWNSYGDLTKQVIFERLSSNMSHVVKQFLDITDESLLLQQLQQYQIRYHSSNDPFCWAHHLLRIRADKINDLSQCGLSVKPPFCELSLRALFTLMDKKLYELSLQYDQHTVL